jgi:hypothetical protein
MLRGHGISPSATEAWPCWCLRLIVAAVFFTSVSVMSNPARAADIQLRYRLQMVARDSSGAYVLSGTLKGGEQARATVRLRFENGSSGRTGTALVHTHWKVLAEPDSKSFEAELRGTLVMVSGQTHLVGTITSGARRSRRVETESRLLDFGVNGQISEVDGLMTIAGQ